MRHHPVDIFKIDIGRHIGSGQHVLGIEDIQTLVFHRPHVEIADCDYHVMIQIALQPKSLFIPAHRLFQSQHGVIALIEFALFDVNRQIDLATRCRAIGVMQHIQISGHHGKQITGFRVRVLPSRPVTTARLIAATDRIAIREQLREHRLIGVQGDGVARHHIRTVGKPGDAAKSLRLALGKISVSRTIQTGQTGVVVGVDTGHRLK